MHTAADDRKDWDLGEDMGLDPSYVFVAPENILGNRSFALVLPYLCQFGQSLSNDPNNADPQFDRGLIAD